MSDAAIVEDFMKRLIAAEKGESDDIPDEPPGFHHDVHLVTQTWFERKLHHIYPESGGLLAQDSELMADWTAMSLWYVRCENDVYSFTSISMPGNAPDISSQMGD